MAKILFFAPHAAIWSHAFPEALVAETLQQGGNEVIYVTCGTVFKEYCTAMSAYGLVQESSPSSKVRICEMCQMNKGIIREQFDLQGYDLEKKLTLEDQKKIDSILSQINQENYLDLKVDEISIAHCALYEFLLQHKKSNLTFSELEWSRYRIALKNTLISYFTCRTILEEEKPDRVLTYNSLYSVNWIFCQLAEKLGIPTYSLHAGGNLSNRLGTLMIGRESTLAFLKNIISYWPEYKNMACSKESLKFVTDHFIELFRGKSIFAYSSSKQKGNTESIRERFSIASSQKILVATMSSYDERFAAETIGAIPNDYQLLFPKQVDWIRALIEYAKNREDLFLIVRVHPREFPNKRESVKSEHAKMLEVLFEKLPINIGINWPTDNLSIYDLAEETDVFLNAWSSVGKEMSVFGIPVVLYSPQLIFYPADLNYVGTTEIDYFAQIEKALQDGWNFEHIRQAYRWYSLEFEKSLVIFSNDFGPENLKTARKNLVLSFAQRAYNKLTVVLPVAPAKYLISRQLLNDCRKRKKYVPRHREINELMAHKKDTLLEILDSQSLSHPSEEEENRNLRYELKRLTSAMYPRSKQKVQRGSLQEKLLNAIEKE
jgi:hypothetical protein